MANFKGTQFDLQTVQAKDDANTNMFISGVYTGIPNFHNDTSQLSWNFNYNNKVLYVYPSKMLLQGRLIEVTTTQAIQFPLPNGANYLGLNIDLNRTNTNGNVVQIVGDTFVPGNTTTDSLLKSNTAFIPVFSVTSDVPTLYEYSMIGRRALYSGMKLTADSASTPSPYTDFNFTGTGGRAYVVRIHVQSSTGANGSAIIGGVVISGSTANTGARQQSINFLDFANDKNNVAYTSRSVRVEIIPSYTQSSDVATIKTRIISADTINWTGKSTDSATRYQYGNYSVALELVPYASNSML